ncbi:MAG: protein kinase [Deltaproteobacteria bacterium]|nr:protein kinase [Deltaproteobacteria bacterium]
MAMSLIGRRLGNYDIQSKIGEGGMGLVYLGIHPQIGKKVAVKVLHEELCSKADVVARFFNEAKAVNDISHPNIVDIIDFGETTFDGVICKYIIMEYLDGESLAARMRREGVSIRETLHILAQCASALAASHAKGVVHRDLKPENVYLCTRHNDRNYTKLLDFGIAKLTADTGGAMSQHTRTGMVIGTPTYMSPEQCDGKGLIDARADIYALGVMMYELLCGRVPFPGDGFGEVLVAHLTREPEPPRQYNPNIPPEVEAIALRCLRKKKEERFQSMNDMLAALMDPAPHYQTFLQGLPAPVASQNLPQLAGGSMIVPSQIMAAALGGGMQPMQPMSSGGVSAVPPMASGAVPVVSSPAGQSSVGAVPPQSSSWATQGTPALRPNNGSAAPPVMQGIPPMQPAQQGAPAFSSELQPVTGPQSGTRSTTLSGASGEAGSRRRPLNVMLGFAGAIVIGVMSVLTLKLASRDPGTQVAAASAEVKLMIKTNPAQAEIEASDEGGQLLGKSPLSLTRKKSDKVLNVKLKLAGYKEVTRSIELTGDQVVQVDLDKAAPPPKTDPGTDKPVTETGSKPVKPGKEPKTVKEPKEPKTVKEPKEPKTVKEPKEPKTVKEPKEPKTVKEPKAVKDPPKEPGKKKVKGKKPDDLLAPVF